MKAGWPVSAPAVYRAQTGRFRFHMLQEQTRGQFSLQPRVQTSDRPCHMPMTGGHGRPRFILLLALMPVICLSACAAVQGNQVATNSPLATAAPSASAAPGAAGATGGVRTVLTPDGLNIRTGPSLTATVEGILAQGVQLSVLGYTAAGGGWYHVKDSATSGWISSNPALSTPHVMETYVSASPQFTVLYRSDWTYVLGSSSVVFSSDNSNQSITVTLYPSAAPSPGGGSIQQTQQVGVCGGTDPETLASQGSKETATLNLAEGGGAVLQVVYTYSSGASTGAFSDFYNSIVFPGPGCNLGGPP